MAEQNGDKTEKPSHQKLKKAREQGQVVRSRDLSTAIGVLISLRLFVWMVPTYLADVIVAVALLSVLVATLLTQYRVHRK